VNRSSFTKGLDPLATLAAWQSALVIPAAGQPLDSDLTAIAALTTTAFGRALLELADAAAGRVAFAAAAISQTTEPFYGAIFGSLSDRSYTIVLKATEGGTITSATTKCVSGTATATFKVNTTALGGTANAVSSAEQSQAHSTSNTFVAGDDIVVTISANASCTDFSFSLQWTRTLL